MAYVVLARKYRPRSFAQMVGQEHVVQALSNALQQQRLHHAYLFTGTRGIGKTTVSRILAKSLNCTGPDGTGGITAEPCGVCQACTEIDADRFIDYIEMDAASNGGKDEIKDLIERAAYKPGVGRFKVFMIDEAHQLSKDAFNALLKTLEEPPEYLKFVLATTDPEKVLPTVLSRCLQFNLRPMAPSTVREHLQRVLTAENVPFDDSALALLGRAARGSMRDGLSLTDQAIAYGGGRLSQDVVRAMLGSVDRGHTMALVQALAAHDGPALLAVVDGLRALGLSAAATLDELALLLQQMAVEQTIPGALDAQDPDTADARQAAPLLAADETQLLYSMALKGREELGLVSDEYAALTMVLLRFLAFSPQGQQRFAAAAPREARTAPLRAPAPPTLATKTVSAEPQQPVRAEPQQPVWAEPQQPVRSERQQPVRAEPQQPVRAEPQQPVRAEPQQPVRAEPHQPVRAEPKQPVRADPVDPLPAAVGGLLQAQPERTIEAQPERAIETQVNQLAEPEDQAFRIEVPPLVGISGTATTQSAANENPVPTDLALGQRWDDCVKALIDKGLIAALVKGLAAQAGLRHIDDSAQPPRWHLVVALEPLRNPVLGDKLAAALQTLLGYEVALELEAGSPQDSPMLRDAADRQRRQEAAEATIQQDPVVLELLAQFKGARIVPGSIKPL